MSQGQSDINVPLSQAGGAASATFHDMLSQGRSFSGRERNCAYMNTGGQRFANISTASGIDFPDDGRAVGVVDWDQDGDLDLWMTNRNGPQIRLLRNDIGTDRSYVSVRLVGRTCNRDAIGARVEVMIKSFVLIVFTPINS